jgi:hypothetical protein
MTSKSHTNEISQENRHKSLVRRGRFAALVTTILIAAGIGGFYLGWQQVKRPLIIIAAFEKISSTPTRANATTPAHILELARKFKRHDYMPFAVTDLSFPLVFRHQARQVLFSFSGASNETLQAIRELHQSYGYHAILFASPDEVSNNASAAALLALYNEIGCKIGLQLSPESDIASEFANLAQKIPVSERYLAFSEKIPAQQSELTRSSNYYGFIYADREVGPETVKWAIPRIKHVKGASSLGAAEIEDWLPPVSARRGALTITLAILLLFIALSWFGKARLFFNAARALEKNR